MSLPDELSASTACSAPTRESAKLQELLVKLDKALTKLSQTSTKVLTMPKL
jgi:hypothetical protein